MNPTAARHPFAVAAVVSLCWASPGIAQELPRVLLIGDSISIGYTKPVQGLLDGIARVERVPGNAGHTRIGLEGIHTWIDPTEGSWDVIHFNWGLWDLCYRDPASNNQGHRDKIRGELTHTIEEYTRNLDEIVTALEASGAELIFATTTPVPEGELGRKLGDDLRYNAAATELMRRRGVAINDLHALVEPRMGQLARGPGDVHFTQEGSELLAAQVAQRIRRALAHRNSSAQGKKRGFAFAAPRIVEYKRIGDVSLALHVFEPDGHRPGADRPSILFFFGGGWNGGSPSQFYPHCDHLASRGMVAIAAEYRVNERHGTTPFECVEDGKSAVRFVRENSKALGVDPARIAAGGGSAGGHVAAAVATVPGLDAATDEMGISCVPDALVLFNPVYDNGPDGYGHDRVKERYREISPAHNIAEGMPPTIVFLGTADRLVPVATAQAFQAGMRAVGSQSQLELFEGRPHGFFNHGRGDGRDYLRTLRSTDAFLASLGYLQGAPTVRGNR